MTPSDRALDHVGFRVATRDDAVALADFAREMFDATFGHSVSADDMRRFLDATYGADVQRAEIVDPDMRTELAMDGEGVAGFFQLRLQASPDAGGPDTRHVEISRLYVAARWHGRGLAGALMERALNECRHLGAEMVWLGVWEENARAITFYERAGFTKSGAQSFVLGSVTQRDFIMSRTLR